jgi:hypothetical protein
MNLTKTKTPAKKTKLTSKLIRKRVLSPKQQVNAENKFKKKFVKSKFEYFTYHFSKKDLSLIHFMRSNEVNDPKNNRDKTPDNIARLVRTLKAGKWYFETDDIKISDQGKLMNGQHTLDAINQFLNDAETDDNVTIEVGFKVGCRPEAMPYLDTQKRRSAHQTLKINNNGSDNPLNRTQLAIVLTEAKRVVHGIAFPPSGAYFVNPFEYEEVIAENQKLLNKVFADRVLSQDFPHKAIGYAIFNVAKHDEELAVQIMDEITEFHNDPDNGLSDTGKPLEHPIVELFRAKRAMFLSNSKGNARNGYRSESFYPHAIDYLCDNYDVDAKIFPQ